MNTKRVGALLGIATVASVGLAACSSDDSSSSASGDGCEVSDSISASGSSAQRNAMTVFANAFDEQCGGQIDYNANGSGSGVSEFTGGQTAFAGSDSALKDDEYKTAEATCGSPAWNLPMVFGPIAIAYKLDGVDEPLTLNPEVTAKIFKGEINKWNDPAIADLNKGVDIPDTPIVVVFRSDESGTTDNFQKYLDSAAGPEWGKGAGKTFQGGAGQGAAGNDGVAAAINGANGAITYTEWSFATAQNLSIAKVTTSASDGKGVELNAENVGKSIDTAKLKNGEGNNDLVLDTSSFYKPTDPSAYPLVLATYEIVCSKYEDQATGDAVKSFLKVAASQDVQSKLEDEGYIPVPDSFRSKLDTAIEAIGAGA